MRLIGHCCVPQYTAKSDKQKIRGRELDTRHLITFKEMHKLAGRSHALATIRQHSHVLPNSLSVVRSGGSWWGQVKRKPYNTSPTPLTF
ncbi:hypothetical protein E2C01_017847 [Portunus trituberculatus]|uniref:Uncharacterized protein n=1 Tax=Portunus trituberculatus TaxID=210409 RepID=A0A5B7DSV9_PORTR|nr:hypothetical protein [Portunus trituberculatus]